MLHRILTIPLCLSMCALVGCGGPEGPKTVPAEGTITLDGAPLENASIVFTNPSGSEFAQGLSDADGHFSLNTFEYKTGARPGTYQSVIIKTVEIVSSGRKLRGEEAKHAAEEGGDAGSQLGVENVLPLRYSRPSPKMEFVIPEDGVKDLLIELTSE